MLQDRAPVLEKATVPERVQKMEYDYLTEQPIKGLSLKALVRCLLKQCRCTCLLLPPNFPQ